jgi:hypothetical protein
MGKEARNYAATRFSRKEILTNWVHSLTQLLVK